MAQITLTIFLSITILISYSQKKPIDLDFNAFPKEWVRLTVKDNEKVIFNSCDADNRTIIITAKEDDFYLLENRGQDATCYKIIQGTWTTNKNLLITGYDDFTKNTDTMKVEFLNIDKSNAYWSFSYDNFETKLEYVVSENKEKYKVINEKCD